MVPRNSPKPVIRVLDFSPETFEEKLLETPGEVVRYLTDATSSITWVDVQGLGDKGVLEELGAIFRLHRLALADVVNLPQRPKVEFYDNHVFIVTRMYVFLPEGEAESEQVSLFLGKDFVLTFQETPGDCLDPVRERLRHGVGVARKAGADYLAYSILDAIIDHYFPLVESMGERIERLEDEVVRRPIPRTLRQIHAVKRELLGVRRAIWPQRDALTVMTREGAPFIGREAQIYLRDCQDHAVQLIDIIETQRELVSGLLDVYLSSVANRTNDVMRVLTVVTVIFIPLTFLVGVYGMNFDTASPWNMPELGWRFGYPACWALILAVGSSLFLYFARKGWLRSSLGDGKERRRPWNPRTKRNRLGSQETRKGEGGNEQGRKGESHAAGA